MRISESIRRNVFEVSTGGILNKIKIKRRRNTFFFEEIGALYIRKCEEMGYKKEMMEIGYEWMMMFLDRLLPNTLRKIPPTTMLNVVMRNLWITGGLMDEIRVSKQENVIKIKTKNEGLTRFMGKNNFMVGFYKGVVSSLFGKETEAVRTSQTKIKSEYSFRITSKKTTSFESKDKSTYDKLNYLEATRGFNLKRLLENNVFHLREKNKIYFRDKLIAPVENTMFHLIGNRNLLLNEIPKISYNYFRSIVKETSDTKKLVLIKTLLQAMGWGIIKIVVNDKKILFEINNPPYGLQKEKDNWNFLINTVLGYLWLLNREFRISKIDTGYKHLRVTYSY